MFKDNSVIAWAAILTAWWIGFTSIGEGGSKVGVERVCVIGLVVCEGVCGGLV